MKQLYLYVATSHLLLCWRLLHLVHRAEASNPCIGCIYWQPYGILREFKQLLSSARWVPEVQSRFVFDVCFWIIVCDAAWNVLGHCFCTILKVWRFQKLSMPPPESSRRDLQAEKGPGASGAQTKTWKNRTYLNRWGFFFKNNFENVKWVWNGSGVVGGRLYFVKMTSGGPWRAWDWFWPKSLGKNKEKTR